MTHKEFWESYGFYIYIMVFVLLALGLVTSIAKSAFQPVGGIKSCGIYQSGMSIQEASEIKLQLDQIQKGMQMLQSNSLRSSGAIGLMQEDINFLKEVVSPAGETSSLHTEPDVLRPIRKL